MDHYEPFFNPHQRDLRENLRGLYSHCSQPNPFAILLITGTDDVWLYRQQHRGFLDAPVERALRQLEDPKERLRAEISWLADSTDEQWNEVNEKLRKKERLDQLEPTLPPLSRLNLSLFNLERFCGEASQKQIVKAIHYCSFFSSSDSVISTFQQIQKSRAVSGDPPVNSLQTFIHEVRRYSEIVYARIFALLSQKLPEEIAAILTAAATLNQKTGLNNELLATLLHLYEETIRESRGQSLDEMRGILNSCIEEELNGANGNFQVEEVRKRLGRWKLFVEPLSLASQINNLNFQDPNLDLLRAFRQKSFQLVLDKKFWKAIFLMNLFVEVLVPTRKIKTEIEKDLALITQLAILQNEALHAQ